MYLEYLSGPLPIHYLGATLVIATGFAGLYFQRIIFLKIISAVTAVVLMGLEIYLLMVMASLGY
jgi:hypothetical protein